MEKIETQKQTGPAAEAALPAPEAELSSRYQPQLIEDAWYQRWEREGLFTANPASEQPPFSIVIPPPNVTGSLHIGHALNNTLQDILSRQQRMQGKDVLWVPGCDHAGIATQNVVERELAKQKTSRHDLGREKFIARVWEWKQQYGGTIMRQLRRLGSSLDWTRERFTLDDGLSAAVREVFVRLYAEGLIYRGDYIINWCPRCQTALSDIETEHQDTSGHFWHICYPFADGTGSLVVATTRPETLLGDTAVAVNPQDERYRQMIGKKIMLPLQRVEIPVIADDYVDKDFGSGVVKITPAHDLNDFLVMQRHPDEVGIRNVMNPDGTMNKNAGHKYAGLDRFECRKAVLADLEAEGLLVKTEDHQHAVGHCYRCHTVVEPYLSRQWFVKMKPLAEPAMAAVRDGRIRFTPESWTKVYLDWMENIRDWCISRQIWWGHRIPAWYCQNKECQEVVVVKEAPPACPKCGGRVEQDPDVLDTWFSSALWPFSTLGWPESTPELQRYYPTSVLVTSWDIIFFWVARMAMMGLKFMGDVPFRDVCINSLVGDAEGKKMSKSKGNTVDPLDLMEHTGADGLRFTMALIETQSRYVAFTPDRLESCRNFMNKIWNAARFVLMNLDAEVSVAPQGQPDFADQWILSRLDGTVERVQNALAVYRFSEAAQALYDFVWHEFCDWYLEVIKARLAGDPDIRRSAQSHLLAVWDETLRLLHPFLPFITEEIWSHLPGKRDFLMRAAWPVPQAGRRKPEVEQEMGLVMEVIYAVRNIRGEMNVPPAARVKLLIRPTGTQAGSLASHVGVIKELAKVSELVIDASAVKPPMSATAVAGGLELFIPLEGLIDLAKERERLAKEIRTLEELLTRQEAKLSNEQFISRAPAEVVAAEQAKREDYRQRRERLQHNLQQLSA
ncbi:MAG: valine--tRNA ligase [candidate division FCPU426 bacterium]